MKPALIIFLSSLVIVSAVSAQTATPTPANIRDAVQQQVQQELSNIRQSIAKKGFVGSITAKNETTITITNLRSQTRQATIAPDAAIKLTGGKDGTTADLKVNDFVLAMGDVDSQNKMTVKRLLVLKAPEEDKREVMFGTVTKVASGTITIENGKKETWSLKTSSSTRYSKTESGKSAAAVSSDVKVGSKLVVIGTTGATASTLTAINIHLLP